MNSTASTQELTSSSLHTPQNESIELEKQEEKSLAGDTPDTFPEGGREAWLVVLGATVAVGCSLGYVNAFGVFESYYLQHQLSHKTPSGVAWIGGLQVFFQFFSSLVAGSLFDKVGARMLIIPAAIGLPFSIMMTSLCREYYQFILAQGVFGGICLGFLYTPSVSAVNHFFFEKRGTVSGIVSSGSSLGGVLYPIALKNALASKKLGFGWGIRVVGFAVLGLLVIPCLFVRGRLPPRPKEVAVALPFRQPSYSLLVAGMFLLFWGTFVPMFFISTYAIEVAHMSVDMAFYLLAILNGASLFGRILTGVVSDKTGRMNTLVVIGVIVSILLFCWPRAKTEASLIVWTVIFGFWSGSVISVAPPCIVQITPSPQLIGMYLGLAIGVLSISGLTGSPIAGAIIGSSGYSGASIFSGVTMVAGAVFVAVARFCWNPKLFAKV